MNVTKKRKRGGALGVPVKTCGKKSVAICLAEFLQERRWNRIPILGDGNCFFRSIAKYYEMSGDPHGPNHTQLRQQVADFIERKAENGDSNTLAVIAGTANSVENAIHDIRADKVWNVEIFEIIPAYMARALGVHIYIYDSRPYRAPKKTLWRKVQGVEEFRMLKEEPTMIEENHLPPDGPSAIRINLLRVGQGHYELLWPDMESNHNQNNNNSEFEAASIASLQQLQINNKKTSKKPTVGVLPTIPSNVVLNSYQSNSSVVSNASIASSVNSINGNIENAKKTYPYKTTTVKEIKAMLDKYGIEYHSKDKKEILYGTFIMAFMENTAHRTKNILQQQKQASKQASKVASRKAARNAKRATSKNKS
jgi:hypothetical protein